MNIIHIATRMKHHSLHSGYDRVSDFMACQRFREGFIFKGLGLIPDRVWGLMLRKSKLYLVPELKQELELQIGSWFGQKGVYHFLYGENEFRHFQPSKGSKLFVTYHFPPKKYEEYFTKPPRLQRVNAVIVVGSNQVDYFARWVPREKILLIPHGVDTEYYRPMDDRIRNNKILFVGTHLRDFDLLKKTIERIEKITTNLSFTIVTFKENWNIFQGLKKIELLTEVKEGQLLQYYQSHAMLFLPLVDGTANNTLLEAGACGLPIVTSDVGAVRDYFDDESAILLNSKNIERIVTTIVDVMGDQKKRNELAIKVRNKMLAYDWRMIADKIKKVYESC